MKDLLIVCLISLTIGCGRPATNQDEFRKTDMSNDGSRASSLKDANSNPMIVRSSETMEASPTSSAAKSLSELGREKGGAEYLKMEEERQRGLDEFNAKKK